MSTLLIAIGISKYDSAIIQNLNTAANDAVRVSDCFNVWGVERNNTFILLNEEATREKILNTIRIESLKINDDIDTVIFYYAGHGAKKLENSEPEYILYTHDTDLRDVVGTGINITYILNSLKRLKAIRTFVFIDACYVRIKDYKNDSSYKVELEKHLVGQYCFFSLISTWCEKAYEIESGGVFTTALLSGTAILRLSKSTCMDLAYFVENRLKELDYPLPEVYCHGASDVWLLDGLKNEIQVNKRLILRFDSLKKIYDSIIISERVLICFYGSSLSGKTVMANQLCENLTGAIYYSIKIYDDIEAIKSSIAQLIVTNTKLSSDLEFSDNFEATLEYVCKYNIRITIIFDHSERIDPMQLATISNHLFRKNVGIIMFSRNKINFNNGMIVDNIPFPDLSISEFSTFEEVYNNSNRMYNKELLYLSCRNNPLKLIEFLKNESENIIIKYQRTSTIVCECDGFVDEKLFSTLFKIDINEIIQLLDAGLISKDIDRFIPHESMYENLNIPKTSVLQSENGELYWYHQHLKKIDDTYTCKTLIRMIREKGVEWIEDICITIHNLVNYCVKYSAWIELEFLCEVLFNLKNYDLLIDAALNLAHVARNKVFLYHNQIIRELNEVQISKWNLAKSEIEFWHGEFTNSITTAFSLLSDKTLEASMVLNANLNIAISYFFLGEWEQSILYLTEINSDKDLRIYGWKNLIYGTILAIRGTDFSCGIEMLDEAIRKLDISKDSVGLGIAYNNLGECYFKNRKFSLANYYLEKAEVYSLLIDDKSTYLEILRNKLLVQINMYSSFNNKCDDTRNEILDLIKIITDKTELMQVYNTLATACAYNYEIQEMERNIQMAEHLTEGNSEYYIYTIMNKAIYCLLTAEQNDDLLNQMLDLYFVGGNTYALLQFINDFKNVSALYNLSVDMNNIFLKKILEEIEDANISI